MLQRSLRLNPKEKSLWLTYFRLELLYIEKIKARRRLLAIDGHAKEANQNEEYSDMIRLPTIEDETKVETPKSVRDLSEKTRALMATVNNPYLQGAVTSLIYHRAINAIPNDLEFRLQFTKLYTETGDKDLVDARQDVFVSIKKDFSKNEEAQAYIASANMQTIDTQSPEFVDELERAATAFDGAVNEVDTSKMYCKFLDFLLQWHGALKEPNLRMYLSETAWNLVCRAQ